MDVKRIALVWFRTNLRLGDNECLVKAADENDLVIPFYCLDERLFETTEFGFKKAGGFRLKFLRESLQQLDQELRDIGSGLVLLTGHPEKKILNLAKSYSAKVIYAEKERAPEELAIQQKVTTELLSLKCNFLTFECRNLLRTMDLPFPVADLPEVFTDFRKRAEKSFTVRPVWPKPTGHPLSGHTNHRFSIAP